MVMNLTAFSEIVRPLMKKGKNSLISPLLWNCPSLSFRTFNLIPQKAKSQQLRTLTNTCF
jgi:hypothetical protein